MENRVSKVFTYAITVAILLLISSALIVLPLNSNKAEAAREDYFEFSQPIVHEGTVQCYNYYSSYQYVMMKEDGNYKYYQCGFGPSNSIKNEIPTGITNSYGVIWIDGIYYNIEQESYTDTSYSYTVDLGSDTTTLTISISTSYTYFDLLLKPSSSITTCEKWELIYLAFPKKRIYNKTDLGKAAAQGRMEGYDKKEAEDRAYYEPLLENKFNEGYESGVEYADSIVNKNSESYKQGTYDVNVSLNTIIGNSLSSIGDFIMTILSIEVAGISLWAILAAVGGIILIGIIIKIAI